MLVVMIGAVALLSVLFVVILFMIATRTEKQFLGGSDAEA